jgi:GWxTD domain-containing protein
MTNKNKFIAKVFFLLLICSNAFGQHLFAPGFCETHILSSDTGYTVFFLYRVPYNRFVFIKDGDVYKAGFRINIEVADTNSKHITRQIDEKSFTVDKYEETNSNDIYIEGLCKFSLAGGKFHLSPSITDLNSTKELKFPDIQIEPDTVRNKDFISPFIVYHDQVKCGNNSYYKLPNFNGSIPFSKASCDYIIPVSDTSIRYISAILINGRDTVFKGEINESFNAALLPSECDGNIILKTGDSIKVTKNFIVKNINRIIDEGTLRLVISKDNKFVSPFIINMDVKWFNKPFSLLNPADAIKSLKYIEKSSVIDSLLDFNKDEYEKVLREYWKKYDADSRTKFNPLMDEYYSRIDYAMKNFSALSEKNGAATDRGKTYIKYGTPKKIERSSSRDGKMIERWIYPNPDLVFEFIDQNGAGNYTFKK